VRPSGAASHLDLFEQPAECFRILLVPGSGDPTTKRRGAAEGRRPDAHEAFTLG
jgi:hypothetical protein